MGYDLTYTYGDEEGKKFQLDNVSDVNYRTEATPDENQKTRNSHAYEYDANGNLVYVNTGRTKKDGTTNEKAHERKLKWYEENRLLASDDDGFVTNYWYDTDSERTVEVWARASRYIKLRVYKLTHQHDQVHTLGEPLSRGKPRLTIHQAHLYSQPEYRIQNL